MKITVRPLTPERWPDLEAVFGAKGCSIARGCWCMYYRESGKQALPQGMKPPEARKARMKALVDVGPPPGLIGYRGRIPVGWVTLGPRNEVLYATRAGELADARRMGDAGIHEFFRRAAGFVGPGS